MLESIKGIENLKDKKVFTVYLSGPITKATSAEKATFYRVQNLLHKDFYVINPLSPPDPPTYGPRAVCMRRDLHYILDDIDAIILLPGWRDSEGANVEVLVAWQLSLYVYELIGNTLVEFDPKLDKLPYQSEVNVFAEAK